MTTSPCPYVVIIASYVPIKHPQEYRSTKICCEDSTPDNVLQHKEELEQGCFLLEFLHEDRKANWVINGHSEVNNFFPLCQNTYCPYSNVSSPLQQNYRIYLTFFGSDRSPRSQDVRPCVRMILFKQALYVEEFQIVLKVLKKGPKEGA